MSKSKPGCTPPEPSLSLAIAAETVQLAELKRDPELQCRARGINKRTVQEYAASMTSGAAFPPVTVFRDKNGVLLLADGWHRCAAAELAGRTEIEADVREGDRKAALLHAASANSDHGLRRTLADKRAAVQRLLAAYPKWSDRKIAEAAKVDHKTVGAARKLLAPTEPVGGEFPTPPDVATELLPETAAAADVTRILAKVNEMNAQLRAVALEATAVFQRVFPSGWGSNCPEWIAQLDATSVLLGPSESANILGLLAYFGAPNRPSKPQRRKPEGEAAASNGGE